jgi:diguanylate cyclase (GGDEF)-like protein
MTWLCSTAGAGSNTLSFTSNAATFASRFHLCAPNSDEGWGQDFLHSATLVEARKKLEEKSEILNAVLESINDGIATCDAGGNLTLFNKRMKELAGGEEPDNSPTEEWGSIDTLFEPDGKTPLTFENMPLAKAMAGEIVTNQELVIIPKRGQQRTVICGASPLYDKNGNKLGAVSSVSDITEQRRYIKALRKSEANALHLAFNDTLTGLNNRAAYQELLDSDIDQEQDGEVSALFIDLDGFKAINDRLGHEVGDEFLRRAANILRETSNDDAFVARLGGDEFVVIQKHCTLQQATRLGQIIIDCFDEPMLVSGQPVHSGASVGIAVAPLHGDTYPEIVRRADMAMYRAKKQKLHCATVFRPEFELRDIQRMSLEADLSKSIERNQLEVHFQPIICGRTMQTRSVEALTRWKHPRRGMVPPDEFIGVAEESGFIFELGEWVLRTAAIQVQQQPALSLAVNISPVQFEDPDLVGKVAQILEETGLEPSRLELEITEGVLMHDTENARQVIDNLTALGLRLALDDFGTGYSSLGYIQSFPFDKVKIDRSFVGCLDTNAESAAVVQCVVNLARSLGMHVTAEGVETASHEMLLKFLGCNLMQGYRYGRPMPMAALSETLNEDMSIKQLTG